MGDVNAISDDTFETECFSRHTGADRLLAPWCAPCRAIAPVVDELAREYAGAQGRQDERRRQPAYPQRYGVRGIPT